MVQEAVHETLMGLGVNVSTPTAVIEMQRDFQHLRDWRKTTERVRTRGILVMAGLLVSGLCAALWLGFKSMIVGP